MARADPQALCERFNSAILPTALLETAPIDKSQSPRHCARSSQPAGSSGRTFRAATQARTKACFSRGGGGREVTHVFLFTGWRRANGAAIYAGRQNADKELAIEARISRQAGTRAHMPVQRQVIHPASLTQFLSPIGSFRTMFGRCVPGLGAWPRPAFLRLALRSDNVHEVTHRSPRASSFQLQVGLCWRTALEQPHRSNEQLQQQAEKSAGPASPMSRTTRKKE